eukprot:gene21939-28020_t
MRDYTIGTAGKRYAYDGQNPYRGAVSIVLICMLKADLAPGRFGSFAL